MNTRKRNLSVVGTTSALAIFAFAGTAFAQETPDRSITSPTTQSNPQTARSAQGHADDPRQMAATFGVSELNDIEDWEIMNGGTEVGSIDRIAVDRQTGELLAVVGLEGVVGVNMKEVAIPLSKLEKAGEETLSTDISKEELQRQRDIDPWDGVYPQALDGDVTE